MAGSAGTDPSDGQTSRFQAEKAGRGGCQVLPPLFCPENFGGMSKKPFVRVCIILSHFELIHIEMPQTWLIVGASRGIGLEFVTQLLAAGHNVIATARSALTPNLHLLANGVNGQNLTTLVCDVSVPDSIKSFIEDVKKLRANHEVLEKGVIDVVVLNAGVLDYPNRISELCVPLCISLICILYFDTTVALLLLPVGRPTSSDSVLTDRRSFEKFQYHMTTNAIGPLIIASSLLEISGSSPPTTETSPTVDINIKTLVFISSDSASATRFRAFEDGFGAYSASKAALNQGLRHLAVEISKKAKSKGKKPTTVLAIHPGEVETDMATNVELDWEVEGTITPRESIECMLKVIAEKGSGGEDESGKVSRASAVTHEGEATFWTWQGYEYPW